MQGPEDPIQKRFFSKVNKTESCWLWVGALTSRGYGSLGVNRKVMSAHRYSYETFNGPIPDGMIVCHTCDVRHCVNPEHLWLGTVADNNKDMFDKGRNGASTRRQTHCRKGHLFDEVGVYERVRPNGKTQRNCMECRRESARKLRADPAQAEKLRKYQREYQRQYYWKKRGIG